MARKELSALNLEETADASAVPGAARAEKGLRVNHIARSFGQRQVVRDVSLTVQRGEVAGLLGPNGAGKTTCFYMITGLIPADSGSIWLDGEDITGQPMYQRARMGLGYLAQEASIFRGMTVEQNIKAVVELHHPRDKVGAETTRLLNELRIEHLRHAPASALSGGERRRCEIARALAGRPSFMLLDEPFAGIDPIAVYEVQKIIRRLRDRGLGILITDHNVRETLKLVDRAYLIHRGEVVYEGDAARMVEDPKAREIYLGPEFNL